MKNREGKVVVSAKRLGIGDVWKALKANWMQAS